MTSPPQVRPTAPEPDHDAPAGVLSIPPPLVEVAPARRRSPAEEARTLVAASSIATLATLSDGGHPWGSLVAYATIEGGTPVLFVSTLAEHTRNLERDQRASLVVADTAPGQDVLASGRVTLAGLAKRPEGDQAQAARDAYVAAVPTAKVYADFGDFSLWVLDIARVRWVGGYGRMDSAAGGDYALAEPDPTWPAAAHAVEHLNEDHADALLAIAQALAGYTDATAAKCTGIDRYGVDLHVSTPRGSAPTRVEFAEPATERDGLRTATVELTRRARGA